MDIKIKDHKIYLQILDFITNGVLISNTDGKVLYVNYAFCKACQYTPEEVVGQNPRILKSGIHNQDFYKDMWDTIKSGKTWKSAIVNKAKDGSLYTDRIMISPLKDDNGNTQYFVCTRYNIDATNAVLDQLEEVVSRLQNNLAQNEL